MNSKTLIISAVLPLMICLLLSAQRADFNPALLARGVDSMRITLVDNGRSLPVGQLWDSFADAKSPEGLALLRIYRTVNQVFGPHNETTMARLSDLSLLSRRTYSQSTSDSIIANHDSLFGWRDTGQGVRVRIARPISRGVIEGSLFDALLRAAPLSPSYRVAVPAYLGVEDSIVTLMAQVSGSDSIRQRNGVIADTWRVDMDFAGLSSTLWIDKKSRALVRQVIRFGGPGQEMLMQR